MSKLSSGRTITTSARHGLFGETDAVVIGLPHDFDLNRELQRARRIRIATAFAHQSGWTLIWPAIRKSKADISLLTSLAFCQTEPKILKKWLRLSETGRASARLYVAAQHLFHPKVILVDGAS